MSVTTMNRKTSEYFENLCSDILSHVHQFSETKHYAVILPNKRKGGGWCEKVRSC